MLPKRARSSQRSIEKEGRILFAIRHIRNGATESIREIAAHFEVPKCTLLHRLYRQLSRAEARSTGHILTEDEEDLLVKWILDKDMLRAAPRPSVQETANILRAARGSSPPHTVGKNWSTGFTKHRPELCTFLKTLWLSTCPK